VNKSNIIPKSIDRGKSEKLIVYYNDQKELIKIKRELNEASTKKEYYFYLMDNQLIASQHTSYNTAKIKDKCFMEAKEYYYSEGKTIFATQKNSSYKFCSGEEMQRFERKTPKKLETPSFIFSDELVIIEKLKNFINQKN
jgi:hypothetical protein